VSERRRAILALALLLPAPSLGTWIGMVAAEGTTFGEVSFMVSKVWVFLLPVIWLMLVDRKRPTIPRPSSRGMLAACVTGSLIFVVIGGAYLLFGRDWIDVPFMQERADEVGLDTPLIYLLGAAYWITINSLLEEYVWRWFVVTRCETLMPRWWAVAASGFFFTLHHIIALEVYFDWRISVLGSAGIMVGGMTWSWLYIRYRNIWAAYVSHVFADVIIFAIGYQLLFM
jgi:membrane protease YdiL (CAAX protease family)